MRYENDRRVCANCRWFVSRQQLLAEGAPDGWAPEVWEADDNPEVQNQCRRNAPITTGGMMSRHVTVWPKVKHNDWCGDFAQEEPRVEELREDGAIEAEEARHE